jgi:hypothetical protein
MGYPDSFKIPVSDTQAYRQFGNSVVVPVVERIAQQVIQTLSLPSDHRPELILSFCEDGDSILQDNTAKRVPARYKTKREMMKVAV